jgi:hypothetical protein
MQAAFCLWTQLESFRNPQIFHPKQLSSRRGGHNQVVPHRFWNLLIDKEILKFHRLRHADGLKTVARPPMT